MSEYNLVEKKIADFLNRYPRLKQRAKTAYQRVNYYAFGDRSFEYDLHSDAKIETVSEYFEVSETNCERFFGYFDTSPWNEAMDSAIYHENSKTDIVDIVLYGNEDPRIIASSSAWNHQQGSRTQWHPTQDDQILFNDKGEDELVARVAGIEGDIEKTYNRPIQAVDPQGNDFLSLSYQRLDRNRPDYGYGTDNGEPLVKPDEDGLWLVNLENGTDELLVPLSTLIDLAGTPLNYEHHYINHALYDPTGSQFVFLHRWQGNEGRTSRLYVADRSGECRLLMDNKVVSHYCWLDSDHLFVWGRSEQFGDGYHIIDVQSGDLELVDALDHLGDGHPSLSPDGRWIVTDTYPDRSRQRRLLLYDRYKEKITTVGRFFAPLQYEGRKRCDLHPRWSPDGTAISIDSTHKGTRDSYIIDVSEIVSG